MIKGKRALKIFRFLEFFRKKCLSFREKILEFEFFGLSLSFWALEFFSRRLKKPCTKVLPVLGYSICTSIRLMTFVESCV